MNVVQMQHVYFYYSLLLSLFYVYVPNVFEQEQAWQTKARFAPKRLRTIGDKLNADKRAVIEQKSAFRAFLNVSPFSMPSELILWVAKHTNPGLREFKYKQNRFVFTKDMMRKVYGILCGPNPVVLLTRSVQSDLREVYKGEGDRPDIPTAVKLLESCSASDEATVIRTWDLLCLATVVDPGSSNHMSMEYLGSMVDPTKTDQFAWDELILELAMKTVKKILKQMNKPLVLPAGSTKYEFWSTGPIAALCVSY